MIAIGFLFVRILCDCFRSRWRLEAEILVLRHQLNVLAIDVFKILQRSESQAARRMPVCRRGYWPLSSSSGPFENL
jgi:hypothetical protein